MKISGKQKAFMAVVSEKGFAKWSGVSKATVSLWVSGKRVPTMDKMNEILIKSGATVVQEEIWRINN